jgi:hypothetical protein
MSLSFTRAYRKLALECLISGASPSQPCAWTPTDPEPEPEPSRRPPPPATPSEPTPSAAPPGNNSDEHYGRRSGQRTPEVSYVKAAHTLTRVPTVHPSRVLSPRVDVTGHVTWASPPQRPDFFAVRRAALACLRRGRSERRRSRSCFVSAGCAAPLKAERPALWDEWYKARLEYWRASAAAKAEPARECQLRYDSGESLWAATLRASGAFATANPSAHDEDVLKARTEAGAYATA